MEFTSVENFNFKTIVEQASAIQIVLDAAKEHNKNCLRQLSVMADETAIRMNDMLYQAQISNVVVYVGEMSNASIPIMLYGIEPNRKLTIGHLECGYDNCEIYTQKYIMYKQPSYVSLTDGDKKIIHGTDIDAMLKYKEDAIRKFFLERLSAIK